MEIPPPPPPPPPTFTHIEGSGSEIEPHTLLEPDRKGKHPAPPSTHCVIKHYQVPQTPNPYGKCNKNYVAATGGLLLDGCGEFMPSLNSTPTDPAFLICDACGCHRSYHCETDQSYQPVHHVNEYQLPPHHLHHQQNSPTYRLATIAKSSSTSDSLSPPPISSSYPPAPHLYLPLNQGVPPQFTNNNHPSILTAAFATSGSKQIRTKRFRSKFSGVQKAKMQEFAERIGWKLKKKDEELILGFCEGIGVTRDVFKVWIHNHKNSSVRNNHRDDGGNAIGANGSSSFS